MNQTITSQFYISGEPRPQCARGEKLSEVRVVQ